MHIKNNYNNTVEKEKEAEKVIIKNKVMEKVIIKNNNNNTVEKEMEKVIINNNNNTDDKEKEKVIINNNNTIELCESDDYNELNPW